MTTLCPLTRAFFSYVLSYIRMFTIRYSVPYSQQMRYQAFPTLEKALDMVKFYKSCGSKADLVSPSHV